MVHVLRWSPDGAYVAVGAGDGALSVFDSKTGRVAFELQQGSAAALPATSLRFRPSQDASKTKNVLVSCNAVGAVQHWHVTSGKLLHSFLEDNDNQVRLAVVDFAFYSRVFDVFISIIRFLHWTTGQTALNLPQEVRTPQCESTTKPPKP